MQEIERQLETLAGLEAERETLQRFLSELPAAANPDGGSRGSSRATSGREPRKRRAQRRAAPRARRRTGSQATILEHLGAHPGASAVEIAESTGLERNVIYSILSRLASRGQVERSDADDGSKRYRLIAADGERANGASP